MNVQAVNNSQKTNRLKMYYDFSKISGYSALATGGLALVQGIRHKKSHKTFGVLSFIFAGTHIALIELLKHTSRPEN